MNVKVVELEVEPFGQAIDVFIGDDPDKIKTYIDENYDLRERLDIDNDITDGTFYFATSDQGIYRFICLKEFSQRSINNLQNFIHEAFHAVHHILKQVQVKTKDPHDELTAYLLDCLLGKFLTKIRNKDYKKI